jgi:hypothetical protein
MVLLILDSNGFPTVFQSKESLETLTKLRGAIGTSVKLQNVTLSTLSMLHRRSTLGWYKWSLKQFFGKTIESANEVTLGKSNCKL